MPDVFSSNTLPERLPSIWEFPVNVENKMKTKNQLDIMQLVGTAILAALVVVLQTWVNIPIGIFYEFINSLAFSLNLYACFELLGLSLIDPFAKIIIYF